MSLFTAASILIILTGWTLLVYSSIFSTSFFKVTQTFITYWSVLIAVSLVSFLFKFGIINILDVHIPSAYNYTQTLNLKWFLESQIVISLDVNNLFYILTISIISIFANYHSRLYMLTDQKRERFVLLLNSFALAMVSLVLTKNLIIILLCWELLGITSFFLINHNDTQTSSIKAAMKAITYNRTSDILLLVAVCLFNYITSSMNVTPESLETLRNSNALFTPFYNINILLLFVFLASSIKSVQFFSHMWLPDSMKAPTPASALIHSATLVAAGFYVFLVFKDTFFLFWGTTVFTVVGLLTAIFGAICAVYQDDIKKLLAFSTVANCGFMLTLISAYDIRLFLLYFTVHGVFKSACFMFSGNIIIEQQHLQDTRFYQNMTSGRFINMSGIIVTLLGLAGFPVTITYLLKHHYNVTPLPNYSWYLLDVFFALYSALSMLYALSLIYKLYFLPDLKKVIGDDFDARETLSNSFTNNIYSILSFAIASLMLPAFYHHMQLNSISTGGAFYAYSILGTLNFLFFIGVGIYFKICAFNPDDWTELVAFVELTIFVFAFHIFYHITLSVIGGLNWIWEFIKSWFI